MLATGRRDPEHGRVTMRQEPLIGRHDAVQEADPGLADRSDGPGGRGEGSDQLEDHDRRPAEIIGEQCDGAGWREIVSRASGEPGDDQPVAERNQPRHRAADEELWREAISGAGVDDRMSAGADPDAADPDAAADGIEAGSAESVGAEVISLEADEPRLTVAAVARRLGVAPATLRTWDRRYGLGPSEHSSGKHRRYGPEDVARLEQMQRALLRGAAPAEAARYARTVAPPPPRGSAEPATASPGSAEPDLVSGVLDSPAELEVETASNPGGRGLRLTGAGPRARGLGRAVLALDSWHLLRLLQESIEAQGVLATWREVLAPVQRAVAERWQSTGNGVEALRLLTDSASTALRSVLATAPEPRNPRPVVLAPVPGEQQELELVALAAELGSRGVGHRLFAAGLPPEGLEAAVRRAAPSVVVLWAEQPHYADPGLLAGVPNTRQRSRVLAAGSGWARGGLPGHAESVGSLEEAAERVVDTVLG